MKTGLILEGGAMRGMFTAGVMDVLMENHIQFSGMVGVSAGAVFGCNYKSGQIGRVIRYNKRFCGDGRYASLKSLLTTHNLYNADFCYRQVPLVYDPFDVKSFVNNAMDFYLVTTDVESGQAVYHQCTSGTGSELEWFRASASMPLVSTMVEIEGRKYLDGGIADPIPLRFFERMGYEKNVVILTQPETYIKKPNQLLPVLHYVYKEYPRLVEKMETRHHDYNEAVKYVQAQSRRNKAFVIQPKRPLDIGPVSKSEKELQRVYEEGQKSAWACLESLQAFLNN